MPKRFVTIWSSWTKTKWYMISCNWDCSWNRSYVSECSFFLDFSTVVQALPYSPVENFLFRDHSLFSFRESFLVSEKLGWTFRISRNWEISLIFENRENLNFWQQAQSVKKIFFSKNGHTIYHFIWNLILIQTYKNTIA